MGKTLTALLVAGAIGLSASGGGICYADENSKAPKKTSEYQFQSFGETITNINGRAYTIITQIRTADADGDGDQDIIVGTDSGRLIIYENIMPQKGDEKEEEK